MRLKILYHNSIDSEVLTGNTKGTRLLIPCINLTFFGTFLPLQFQRTQFPIIPVFAVTVNNSHG